MKKKILFPFYGKSYGGAHISTINFVKYLEKNSNYDPVIVLNYRGKFYNYLKKNKIKFVYLKINNLVFQKSGFLFNIRSFFSFLKISSKFIKNNNISIVHGNTFSENLSWSIVCKIKNIDFVYSQSVFIHLSILDFYIYFKQLYKSLNTGGLIYIDIIDCDVKEFTLQEDEFQRQLHYLELDYLMGTKTLYHVNSSSTLVKTANDLGYELVWSQGSIYNSANVSLIFKKV